MAISITNNSKIVSISAKRQITIPQAFFIELGFGSEAECIYRDNELIIRPTFKKETNDFSEQLLEELINDGFSGQELLTEFKKRQPKIKASIQHMLKEAENVASGKSKFMTIEDIFADE